MKEHVQISEMLQRLEEILLQPDIGMNNQTHKHMLDLVARFDSFVGISGARRLCCSGLQAFTLPDPTQRN